MSPPTSSARSIEQEKGFSKGWQAARATVHRVEATEIVAEASPRRPPRARLEVLPGKEELRRRRSHRISRLLIAASVAVIIVALLATVAAHSYIAEQQFNLDNLRQTASEKFAKNQELELRIAQLQQPSRIVGIARGKLGMIPPPSVMYLSPKGRPSSASTGKG